MQNSRTAICPSCRQLNSLDSQLCIECSQELPWAAEVAARAEAKRRAATIAAAVSAEFEAKSRTTAPAAAAPVSTLPNTPPTASWAPLTTNVAPPGAPAPDSNPRVTPSNGSTSNGFRLSNFSWSSSSLYDKIYLSAGALYLVSFLASTGVALASLSQPRQTDMYTIRVLCCASVLAGCLSYLDKNDKKARFNKRLRSVVSVTSDSIFSGVFFYWLISDFAALTEGPIAPIHVFNYLSFFLLTVMAIASNLMVYELNRDNPKARWQWAFFYSTVSAVCLGIGCYYGFQAFHENLDAQHQPIQIGME